MSIFESFLNRKKSKNPNEGNIALYRSLQVKEVAGTISEEDFAKLVGLEIERESAINLPPEDKFFVREELKKISALVPEDKQAALDKFKERLLKQQESLMRLRVLLEQHIELNPDITLNNLQKFVAEYGATYKLTNQQTQDAMEATSKFYDERQKVKDFREKYPDDLSLIYQISGLRFEEKDDFKISMGLMSVDICTKRENYGLIYRKMTGREVSDLSRAAACSFKTNDEMGLPFNVYIADLPKLELKAIQSHEDEHQKNAVLRELFDKKTNTGEIRDLFSFIRTEQDPGKRENLLKSFMRLHRGIALREVKDEILALKKDARGFSMNIFFQNNGNEYDFLAGLRDNPENDPLWQKVFQEVLVEEYRDIILKADDAFDTLKNAYTREEIIALFTDKDLADWPKTARRILEQKTKEVSR